MLIERADFLNTTPEQQAKQLETIREKIKDRMLVYLWPLTSLWLCSCHCFFLYRELMEKYSKVDYDHLMRNP